MASFDNFTKLAAVGAVAYVIWQIRKANKEEAAVDNSYVKMAEYRNAGQLCDNPVIVANLYRDGPLSWVAEDTSGRKWVAYGSGDKPPASLSRRATLVSQI
ncbi:hypothetical protein [Yaravirus sp. 'brasiliensis']|uniref:Uncharacterized protein n=1 Tax=Yaravirus sp. 'brasiliensis' TaxID=2739681 RepID=A0AAE7B462_9VIRU|nr:hypothetical protein QKS73_gp07 [Yaravirus brasiliensis]QKE44380.1 hypothetical protein [Yaravirus brasiliensis]